MAQRISFVVLLIIIGVISVLFYRVMQAFLLPLFLAALMVVIFRPAHEWILHRCKGRKRIAAGLTTAFILLVVLIPIAWTMTMAIGEGAQLATKDWTGIKDKLANVRERFGLELSYEEPLEELRNQIRVLQHGVEDGVATEAFHPSPSLVAAIQQGVTNFETELAAVAQSPESTDRERQQGPAGYGRACGPADPGNRIVEPGPAAGDAPAGSS